MLRLRLIRSMLTVTPAFALLALAPFNCPWPGQVIGAYKFTDNFWREYAKADTDDTTQFRVFEKTYSRVAPDQDFVVSVTVSPLDDSLVCAGQPDLCPDTAGLWLVMRCSGVEQSFQVPLTQQGAKAVGSFRRQAKDFCVDGNGQRNAVEWELQLFRSLAEAVRFDVTVEYVDFDSFQL